MGKYKQIIKTFYTPSGQETRPLTDEEIEQFALDGDNECRQAILQYKYSTAATLEQRVALLEKYCLGDEIK